MSNHLISEVYKRQLGTMARNAVMALLADKASDDGTGIWASKQRMADELGTTKQTVITTIKSLLADDLLKEAGQRKSPNGYTVEYTINVAQLTGLPLVASHQSRDLTGKAALPVKQLDGTGKAALPEPKETPLPKNTKRALPIDWKPEPFGPDSQCRAIVDSWSAKELATQIEHFSAHHRGKGNRFLDWQDVWKTWVLNSRRFAKPESRRPANDGGSFLASLGSGP